MSSNPYLTANEPNSIEVTLGLVILGLATVKDALHTEFARENVVLSWEASRGHQIAIEGMTDALNEVCNLVEQLRNETNQEAQA